MTTALIHRLMRYKAPWTSSLDICTRTVPLALTLNHATMLTYRRNRSPRREGNRQLGTSFSHLFGVYLQGFRSRRDGDPLGLVPDRSCRLAPVLSQ